jgi:hypothetical protein
MKLGIAMLIIGLIFAGFGFGLWNFVSLGGLPGVPSDVATAQAVGMGVTVFGGGLSIGGIVRMVVKK